MSGRESPRRSDDDPDDWFGPVGDEPSRPAGRPAVETPAGAVEASVTEDDWLDAAPADGLAATDTGLTVRLGTLLVAAAILLVLILVAGLAVGGVFSGGGKGETGTTTAGTVTTTRTPSTTLTTPAAPVFPAPATTLKPGDTGAQVKRLQRALKHLGYSVGAVDGDYGTSTEAAVTSFQQTSKLTADGVLGPKTLQALKRALLAKA